MRYTRGRRSWGAHPDLRGCLSLSRSYGPHLRRECTNRIFMRWHADQCKSKGLIYRIGFFLSHTHVLFILACPSLGFGIFRNCYVPFFPNEPSVLAFT
jgi:hypothetical protein